MSSDPKHDKVFYVTFAGVLAFLVTFTLAIHAIAGAITPKTDDPQREKERIEARTAPVGKVITDAAALALATPAAPARAPMSGADVAAKVCNACHGTGVLNAPKTGDKADWSKRLAAAGGMDGLVKSAIAGKGNMPPKGGDPTLSDAELKAAVEVLAK